MRSLGCWSNDDTAHSMEALIVTSHGFNQDGSKERGLNPALSDTPTNHRYDQTFQPALQARPLNCALRFSDFHRMTFDPLARYSGSFQGAYASIQRTSDRLGSLRQFPPCTGHDRGLEMHVRLDPLDAVPMRCRLQRDPRFQDSRTATHPARPVDFPFVGSGSPVPRRETTTL